MALRAPERRAGRNSWEGHAFGVRGSSFGPDGFAAGDVLTDQEAVSSDHKARVMVKSEPNLKGLYERGVSALIADRLMRQRDERFAAQARYKALRDSLWDKTASATTCAERCKSSDFYYDPAINTCLCSVGEKLYSTGSYCTVNSRVRHNFQGAMRNCAPCHLRERCLRHAQRTPRRLVAFFAKKQSSPLEFTERMKTTIDSELGRMF